MDTTTARQAEWPNKTTLIHNSDDIAVGGDTVWMGRYNGMSPAGHHETPTHVEVPCTTWGDYTGDSCNRSNYRSLIREYPDTFVEVKGGHDSHYLALPLDAEIPTGLVQEIVSLIEQYPIYDEDDHSQLEMEIQEECWNSFGCDEFRREIEKQIEKLRPDLDSDDLFALFDNEESGWTAGDELDRMWWEHVNNGTGEELGVEGATSAWFEFGDLPAEIAQKLIEKAGK